MSLRINQKYLVDKMGKYNLLKEMINMIFDLIIIKNDWNKKIKKLYELKKFKKIKFIMHKNLNKCYKVKY